MSNTFKTLDELFQKYQFKTANKFIPLAKKYGFNDETEIKHFLKNIPRDQKLEKPKYLPIYSKTMNSYQMDILVQSKSKKNCFLIIINVNTRKAYAYEMASKSSAEVLNSLKKFVASNNNISSITSDQEPAFLSREILQYLKSNNIDYWTTSDNNHNVLGIINRFMKTIRDLNDDRDFTNERLQELINEYNDSPHKGINNLTPNSMNIDDEIKYIENKNNETQLTNIKSFKEGDLVRIILEKNVIGKKRSNLSKESYIIDGKDRNMYIIKANDGSIDLFPAYKLVKCDSRYKVANTIKNGKRGVIEKIISYNSRNDSYKVKYDEGTEESIPSKNLRETRPTKLSDLEIEYWKNKKSIPVKIKKWI